MQIKRVLPITSLLFFTPFVEAESFYHTNAELSYAEGIWSINTEHVLLDNVHMKTLVDKKKDISETDEASAETTDITVGLAMTHMLNANTEVYGSVNLGVSKMLSVMNGESESKDVNVLTSPVVGFTYSQSSDYEFDFNVSYDFVDLDRHLDDIQSFYNTLVFKTSAKYHLSPAMTISAGYHWSFSEEEIINLNNVVLSFRLNFEPSPHLLMY